MSTAPVSLASAGQIAIDADVLLYTGNELAAVLRIARKTITRMDQSGRLPRAVRIAGRSAGSAMRLSAGCRLRATAPRMGGHEELRRFIEVSRPRGLCRFAMRG